MLRLSLAFLLALALPAAAQAPPDTQPYGPAMDGAPADGPPALSDAASVSLLTMLPGEEVYSLFGHSALRIRDAATGLDRTYNYGTFDFEQPFFMARFIRGDLNYILDTAPFDAELAKYLYLGRPIIEQRLDLPPDAVRAMLDALETNARPENRAYRYDFLFDNCSTRLLGVIDTALVRTGAPPVTLAARVAPLTFRERLDTHLGGVPLLRLGMFVGIGQPTDVVPTPRQETFLPLDLAAQLDGATVDGRPLVVSRDTLFHVPGEGLPARAPDVPSIIAWLALAAGALLTLLGRWRDGRAGRWADAALFGLAGLVGAVLLFLWTATSHAVTRPNWNLLWAWPTHLGAAVMLARGAVGAKGRIYLLLTAVASLVVAAAGPLAHLLPQTLPPTVLPVALLLAVRAGAHGHAARPSSRPESAAALAEGTP